MTCEQCRRHRNPPLPVHRRHTQILNNICHAGVTLLHLLNDEHFIFSHGNCLCWGHGSSTDVAVTDVVAEVVRLCYAALMLMYCIYSQIKGLNQPLFIIEKDH